VTKEILYVLRDEPRDHDKDPHTEEMLAVQSVRLYVYDDSARLSRVEHRRPDMRQRMLELFGDDGKRERNVWFRADGTPEGEQRYGRDACKLGFDETGDGLVYVSGRLPEDVDLVHGWGKDTHGLSCGIAASNANAPLKDIRTHATVRNRGDQDDETMPGARLVLVNADGDVVPQTAREAAPKPDAPREEQILEPVEPGCAVVVLRRAELRQWYDEVPPGEYSLTVVCRDSEGDYSLVSNTIRITIQGDGEQQRDD
jgi:hypothetical protein